MKQSTLEKLRYPIGHFTPPTTVSDTQLQDWIAQLEAFPVVLENLVGGLNETQLETPYRPGGWTIRQVVHHLADSHHNSYTRFKWGLTEDTPVIKPYNEKAWAELFDTRTAPIEISIKHLKVVHAKLVYLLKGLSREMLQKSFIHPDNNEASSLEVNIGRYAWHGNHHYNHIKNLLQEKGWLAADAGNLR